VRSSALVLEDGRRWGEAALPWQVEDARAILGEDGPRQHYLTRPRGASKTTDLAAVCIAALLEQLPAASRSYAFAVDRDQAALLGDAIAGLVARTDGLGGALQIDTYRVTATRSGARLDVMAADDAGAWGLRPHFVVVDEFAQWPTTHKPQRLWHAIASAVPKVADCRLIILTTAGDPAHFAHDVLVQAQASPRWRVHEVRGPCPWIDPGALEEQKAMLPGSEYARLHLNRWVAAEDRLVDPEDLAACVVLDGPLDPRRGVRYVVGVDIGITHDRTGLAVCHADKRTAAERPRVVLDRIFVFGGSRSQPVRLATVEATLLDVCRRYHGARVHLDPWQAVGLAQRLRTQGVRADEFTFSGASVGRLASTLHLLLRDRALALPEDHELLDELANVRLRETSPGVLRIDHDPGRHDDRVIALALAATALVATPPRRPAVAYSAAHRLL
jgi:phage terminase large subunit-like protein